MTTTPTGAWPDATGGGAEKVITALSDPVAPPASGEAAEPKSPRPSPDWVLKCVMRAITHALDAAVPAPRCPDPRGVTLDPANYEHLH